MGFTDEEKDFICISYVESGGGINYTQDALSENYGITVSPQAIRRILKQRGIKINSHGGYRAGIPKDVFFGVYKESKGDFSEIKGKLNLTRTQLINLGRRYKVSFLDLPSLETKLNFCWHKIGNGKINTSGKKNLG